MIACIFNRTQSDVDRVNKLNDKWINRTITEAEIEEWRLDLKGSLNASDLNRIESNIEELSGYLDVPVQARTDWRTTDFPKSADYARILDNLAKLRDVWAVLSTTPDTPDLPLNTYKKWNDIEHIINDLYNVYERTEAALYYCDGEIYAGEETGVI